MRGDWLDEARRQLLKLRRGPAAWGYRARTSLASEPSSLAGLALVAADPESARQTARWLASIRRPDGSIGVSLELPEPGWPTAMALLLWAAVGGFEADRAAAGQWLVGSRGSTAPKAVDDPMGHDGMLVGWPWVAGTHSWVEPTSMAILAMARQGMAGHPRVAEGVRVLRDRAIPGSGWNLGNPVVFGTSLRPLPGPTGLALLALARVDRESPVVKPAIAYLRETLTETLAPISIGWGALGLRAWGQTPDWLDDRLALAFDRASKRGAQAVELAMLLLASGDRSLEILGFAEPAHV